MQKNAFVVTKSYDKLLRAIFEHRLLSVEQTTRLLGYKPGSLTAIRARLYGLKKHEYLLQHLLPTTGIGQSPAFYSLARAGINYFQDEGAEVPYRYRPVEQKELSY